MITAKTGVTTPSQFRVSDLALGRQGCPSLLPGTHSAQPTQLSTVPSKHRRNRKHHHALAGDRKAGYDFDTGPGNVLIDGAMRFFTNGEKQYDKDGVMGVAGKVDQAIVDEILAGPYFVHDIPKTTGRETFGESWSEDIC